MTDRRDAIIIGGGFYGCAIALFLSRYFKSVTIVEQKDDLLMRASFVNQARVHTGYHYPRSLQTAASSARNLVQFKEIYDDCIDSSYTCLYAVAAAGSKINSGYFERFCRQIDLPIKEAPDHLERLFSNRTISAVYECEEYAFDADALRSKLKSEIEQSDIELLYNTTADSIEKTGEDAVTVTLSQTGGNGSQQTSLTAPWVFNTTYANLNQFQDPKTDSGVGLRHQITEMCLVEVPDILKTVGVTVMDGPYFSVMPFPARNTHSLSHVRYTPHVTWNEKDEPDRMPDAALASHEKLTRYEWMIRDAKRYMPILGETTYQDSLFEIKSTLQDTQIDDARPIAFHRDPTKDRLISILGGKIDNIFDILRVIEKTLTLDE